MGRYFAIDALSCMSIFGRNRFLSTYWRLRAAGTPFYIRLVYTRVLRAERYVIVVTHIK